MIKKLMMPLLMAGLMLGFSGCSSDDDENPDFASQVAGTYGSGLAIAIGQDGEEPNMDGAGAPSPADIVMTRTGNETMTLSLKDFKLFGFTPLELTINNVKVAQTGNGEYKLTYSGLISFVMAENPMEVNATVVGTIQRDKFLSDITVDVPEANMKVLVHIEGTKK